MKWFSKDPGQPARVTDPETGTTTRTNIRITPAKDPSRPPYTKTLPGEICDDAEIRRRQNERRNR